MYIQINKHINIYMYTHRNPWQDDDGVALHISALTCTVSTSTVGRLKPLDCMRAARSEAFAKGEADSYIYTYINLHLYIYIYICIHIYMYI
jgi:hypothetical protein